MENNDETETLDIVDLIDKNPITRLTRTYQRKNVTFAPQNCCPKIEL